MEILKIIGMGLVVVMGLSGCANTTVTKIDYVESDTYINMGDASNHSESAGLNVSLNSSNEERILIKLPTGKRDPNENLEGLLSEPLTFLIAPYLILVDIFADLFNCRSKTLSPLLLLNAKVVLDVISNDEGSLANKLQLQLVAKPWWQTASWKQAHVFSSSGNWAQAGGDLDPAFTAITPTVSGATLEFDITQYFKNLLTVQAPHYGMMVRASGASLSSVTLASTQYANSTQRPRVVSTYSCVSSSSALNDGSIEPVPHTYILGSPRGQL